MKTDLLNGFYLGNRFIDPRRGQVSGQGGSAHLPPKAMEVLLCLASSPGELVTREALLEAVWGEGKGSQEALSHAVSEVRHALDDHADHPTYIQTLPRRGYRLLLDAQPANADSPTVVFGADGNSPIHEMGLFENLRQRGVLETAIAYLVLGWLIIQVADIVFEQLLLPAWAGTFVTVLVIAGFPIAILLSWFLEFRDGRAIPHELTPREQLRRRFSNTYLAVVGALAIAAVGVFVYDQSVGLPQVEETHPEPGKTMANLPPVFENSIAVLPFMNVDGSEQTSIFANGLVDDVITSLARVPGLFVSARGDSFALDPNTESTRVRERLRVAMYLEGSVQIEGDSIRVILQLIDTETGFHVLSRSITRPLEGFFEMRDEITNLTVANIRVALPEQPQVLPAASSNSPELDAYMLYRRGKEIFEQPRTIASLAEVVRYYEQALAIDPDYTAAFAGLCATYVARYELSNDPEDIDSAEDACARALNSNPRLHLVYRSLGDLYQRTARYDEAFNAYREALAINPQDAQTMRRMAMTYERRQQYDDAESLLQRAVQLQPGSWRAINSYGGFLFALGRFEEAADQFRQVVRLDPSNRQAWSNLGGASLMQGAFDQGRAAYEESIAIQDSEAARSNLGVLYYYLGEFEKSVEQHQAAIDLNPSQAVKWLNLADSLYFNGDRERALDAFGKAKELADSRLSVDAEEADTLFLLGWSQYMLGDSEAARQSVEAGARVAPANPYGFYYSALIDLQEGDPDAAIRSLKGAMENGYPGVMLAAEPYLAELRGRSAFRRMLSTSDD